MKRLRILGLSLLALFAFGAVMAGVALGAEEGALPPQNFTIKGGEQKLENLNGESITCKTVKGEGVPLPEKEPDRDTHSTGTLDFEGCTALGAPANSLGDASGTILAKVLYLLCLVESKKLVWGVLVAPKELPFHIEVPLVKALILVKGAIIGLLLTKLKGAELEGEPEVKEIGVIFVKEDPPTKKCSLTELGTWTASYEAALDTKVDVDAWQVGEADITFAAATKLMDK